MYVYVMFLTHARQIMTNSYNLNIYNKVVLVAPANDRSLIGAQGFSRPSGSWRHTCMLAPGLGSL